ncbi:MAG: hypothetical protein WEC12_05060, partial [Balneolaceae bacterium]
MKQLCSLLLPVLLFFTLAPEKGSAQFEGRIEFRAYEPDNESIQPRHLSFTATPQRVSMNSNAHF